MKENFPIRVFNAIDAVLKFPNLKKGETGIQVGFDLSSKSLTTDVLKLQQRVGNEGLVVAIDPDPLNIEKLQPVIQGKNLNIKLVQKATYSHPTNEKLVMGTRASYNKIETVKGGTAESFTEKTIEVELDTLDNIVDNLNIDHSKISHINITNNGAEYATLKGMEKIFENCPDLNLSIASGRPGPMGEIDGRRDHEVIMGFLQEKGFTCKLMRKNESFWWGLVVNGLIKRKWVFNKQHFGIIMASRGKRKLKFYQTFS